MDIQSLPSTPTTYEEKKGHAKLHFDEAARVAVSETTPPEITARHEEFAKMLSERQHRIVPVVKDNYGLFGWCSDGVLEKIRNDGGSIVFGWTIWEWPHLMLTAEFHAVWQSESGELIDITPKPHGQRDIMFVPDYTYPHDFDFDKRPRNRRFRIYQPMDAEELIRQQVSQMKPTQIAYEEKRAIKAGKSLNEWMLAKHAEDPLPAIIDKLIVAVGRREEIIDSIPGTGFITPTQELIEIAQKCERLIKRMKREAVKIKMV